MTLHATAHIGGFLFGIFVGFEWATGGLTRMFSAAVGGS